MDNGLIEKFEKVIEEGNQEVLQLLSDVAYYGYIEELRDILNKRK